MRFHEISWVCWAPHFGVVATFRNQFYVLSVSLGETETKQCQGRVRTWNSPCQIKSASSSCRVYCQARAHKCEQPQEICTASVWQSQLRFFCRKIPLRKNTSLQGSATRVLVSSMMDLIIVCCGCYFWPCQWRGEQRHLVSLFCACPFPLSSCARSRSLRHTFAAFVPN